ncbi:DUF2283 domain-containing protein [Thiorhodovibrio frisius]|uniref:DUF2283 domain-containing protein n=1 Tax=Thiorhodovibrio frisius TaxID=631362 RepID=H8Z401_9GAMM|nr:DUF2283 domain-containing protein [Thiorhodovibrio frisius]EIC20070.1 hypothetical protein Thi970DRAFT_03683 [Thiorhodovibrio frisius]WPL20799.1 hypothetical protein Thiofri_00902 [Thiorhodovibrio frisius]
MKSPYLEVTFRHGRPLAAYLYLPRASGERSDYVEQAGSGLLVDFTVDGKPIGVEMTAPGHVSLAELNQVLAALNASAVTEEDVAPLLAA